MRQRHRRRRQSVDLERRLQPGDIDEIQAESEVRVGQRQRELDQPMHFERRDDRQWIAAAVHRGVREQPGQPKAVVAMAVGDQDGAKRGRRESGREQPVLGALAAVDQGPSAPARRLDRQCSMTAAAVGTPDDVPRNWNFIRRA